MGRLYLYDFKREIMELVEKGKIDAETASKILTLAAKLAETYQEIGLEGYDPLDEYYEEEW